MTGRDEGRPPIPPFHVAVPVHDLEAARGFYLGIIGCTEGRSDAAWVDFNLYGHQFVCHLDPSAKRLRTVSEVDGEAVPVPHYGVVLPWDIFQAPPCRPA